jgi:hypothetical protein
MFFDKKSGVPGKKGTACSLYDLVIKELVRQQLPKGDAGKKSEDKINALETIS